MTTKNKNKEAMIVYRDNDTFKEYVLVIEKILDKHYHIVNRQVFEASTRSREIQKWYEKQQAKVDLMDTFSDNTVKIALCKTNKKDKTASLKAFRLNKAKEKYNFNPILSLDDLINTTVFQTILDSDSIFKNCFKNTYKIDNPERYDKFLSDTTKQIIKRISKKEKEKEFIILQGLVPRDFPALVSHEPYYSDEDDIDKQVYQNDKLTLQLRGWFMTEGIANVGIYSKATDIPNVLYRKLINDEAYIVCNRHTFTKEAMENIKNSNLKDAIASFWGYILPQSDKIMEKAGLRFPIGTFYTDVNKKIGFNIKQNEIRENLIYNLENKLNISG